jgi:hypothetical protein
LEFVCESISKSKKGEYLLEKQKIQAIVAQLESKNSLERENA